MSYMDYGYSPFYDRPLLQNTTNMGVSALDYDALFEDESVYAAKILNGAISTFKLANGAVISEKLADLAVEAAKLADGSVIAIKIANLAVGNAAIQNLAVTDAKINDLSVDKLTTGTGTLDAVASIGTGAAGSYVRLDGPNNRIVISDGTNPRIVIGNV
jgi:hypothetical protein